jgi:hypothetical protein
MPIFSVAETFISTVLVFVLVIWAADMIEHWWRNK